VTGEQIACRGCGCVDDDCSACIVRTGEPCSWVEPGLCSACGVTIGELRFVGSPRAIGGDGLGDPSELVFVTVSRLGGDADQLRGTLVMAPAEWLSLWELSRTTSPFVAEGTSP
jgi:hypothetical protein